MIKLSEASKKYVFTTRIDIDNEAYVVLREPTLLEFKKFSDDGSQNLEAARKLFPVCVVDSNFEDDNGNKATGQQIFEVLDKSASTMSRIINEWLVSIPFRVDQDGKTAD